MDLKKEIIKLNYNDIVSKERIDEINNDKNINRLIQIVNLGLELSLNKQIWIKDMYQKIIYYHLHIKLEIKKLAKEEKGIEFGMGKLEGYLLNNF